MDAITWGLPKLIRAVNMTLISDTGAAVSLPELRGWHNGSVTVPLGGSFDLPKLVAFTSSSLDLPGSGTFAAPKLANIDASQIALSAGAQLTIAATSYSATGIPGNQTLFTVTGAGTVLDLSALQAIDDSWNDSSSTSNRHLIQASDGGRIDLSGVKAAVAPTRSEDRLEFVSRRGGQIALDTLRDTSGGGQFRFDLHEESWSLPLLERASRTTFITAFHAQLSLPALRQWTDSTMSVAVGASVALPNLVSFTGGTLELGANQTLHVPKLSEFDNSAINLSEGAGLSLPITNYTAAAHAGDKTLFFVTGTGTSLDLSSLKVS